MEKQKYNILLLSDHPLSPSGVGTQALYLIQGLIRTGRYKFFCLGGAIRHNNYDQMKVSEDFIIQPVNGFGTRETIRKILSQEKIDSIMLFTDPRMFIWVWEMEDEIHQVCPLSYYHVWDNDPAPEYNKVFYESTDLINCINDVTYKFCKEWFPEKVNFTPHALPRDLFFPLKESEIEVAKKSILSSKSLPEKSFIALWVSRNAKRKAPSDILESWKLFLDELYVKHGHRNALLLMKTDPIDENGTNLPEVINMLKISDNVIFIDMRPVNELNVIYNCADVVLSKSSNEGFGLTVLEGMMTATPAIAVKTGGLTRQVVDCNDGSHNGIAIDPQVRTLVGSVPTPYIYEDFVSNEIFAKAIMDMHEYGPDKRKELGLKAYKYAQTEFNIDNLIDTWDKSLSKTIDDWKKEDKKSKQWSLTEL
jgi:glycosyltransferase involved in cell wall biosynthesis